MSYWWKFRQGATRNKIFANYWLWRDSISVFGEALFSSQKEIIQELDFPQKYQENFKSSISILSAMTQRKVHCKIVRKTRLWMICGNAINDKNMISISRNIVSKKKTPTKQKKTKNPKKQKQTEKTSPPLTRVQGQVSDVFCAFSVWNKVLSFFFPSHCVQCVIFNSNISRSYAIKIIENFYLLFSMVCNNPTELHAHSRAYGSAEEPPRVVKNRSLLSHPDDLRMEAYVIRIQHCCNLNRLHRSLIGQDNVYACFISVPPPLNYYGLHDESVQSPILITGVHE